MKPRLIVATPAGVDLNSISTEQLVPQFSDEMLERTIARIENNTHPEAVQALGFALDERARREGSRTTSSAPTAPAPTFSKSAPVALPESSGTASVVGTDPEDSLTNEAEVFEEAEAIALRAKQLVFEAKERGQVLDLIDAVRLARGVNQEEAKPIDRVHELMHQAKARGEILDIATANYLAQLPENHADVVAAKAKHLMHEAAQRGQYLHVADAVTKARRGW